MSEDIGHRAATLHEFAATSKGGPIRAAVSSDKPVAVMGGNEVLSHDESAIDWSRMGERGLPLTIGHSERDPFSQELPIGRAENFAIDGGVMRADLVFDSDDKGIAARGKVERGVAPDISLTFQRLQAKKSGEGERTITRWAPLAVSLVTLPADASVGVGRSLDLADTTEAPEMETEANTVPTEGPSIIETIESRDAAGYARGQTEARTELAAITSRATEIKRLQPALADKIDTLLEAALSDPAMTASRFNELALSVAIGQPAEPAAAFAPAAPGSSFALPGDGRAPVVTPGQDSREAQFRGMELALLERGVPGVAKPEEMQGNQFRGWPMLDICRTMLEAHGTRTFGMSSEQIAKAAIGMRAISPGTANYATTDFPAMTESIGFKAAFEGFDRAPRSWDMWCDTGSVPDFKAFSVPRLSHTSQLPVVAENAAYQNLTRVDAKETGTAVKKGGLVSYTWEAVINNDVNGFTDQMMSSGEAAQATIDSDVYAQLVLNQGVGVGGPVMGDTDQLFDDTNHSNYGTAALDLDGIVATRTMMGRQTDDNGEPIGPRLSYVVVPLELEDAARNLNQSEFLVDVSGTAQRANTVRNTFEVVSTHHLTDATDWFGMARKGQTTRVYFLGGVQAPTLERESGWDTDAIHYKVRIVYVAVPRDWRGYVWNEVA